MRMMSKTAVAVDEGGQRSEALLVHAALGGVDGVGKGAEVVVHCMAISTAHGAFVTSFGGR